ncbi:hypothetical protein RRG08_033404 [Elysia crispata]|uniref:Uncharacterized protein n=1 Tax=Elysia crispata TaxID=231223 RepID=A0AAE1A5R4_9GAST|nr:hypothetical protein RRG08_033404 [Elysia crispata]
MLGYLTVWSDLDTTPLRYISRNRAVGMLGYLTVWSIYNTTLLRYISRDSAFDMLGYLTVWSVYNTMPLRYISRGRAVDMLGYLTVWSVYNTTPLRYISRGPGAVDMLGVPHCDECLQHPRHCGISPESRAVDMLGYLTVWSDYDTTPLRYISRGRLLTCWGTPLCGLS